MEPDEMQLIFATLGLPKLDGDRVRVYSYIAKRGEASERELCEGLEMDAEQVGPAVRGLLGLSLLRRMPGAGESALSVVPPDIASFHLLGPAVREIDQVRMELQSLLPMYEASISSRLRASSVEALHDPATVWSAVRELAARSRTEVLTACPGGESEAGTGAEEKLREALRLSGELLGCGVRMRTLYQHSLQFSPPTKVYVEHVTRLGGEVRTCSGGLNRVIVFDREAVVLAHARNPVGAVVVREPSVVAFATEMFDNAWSVSMPFRTEYNREHVLALSDDVKRRILRLLVEGESEQSIARQLGMSVRTCQRHISDIMQRLGARNRLHAGYLIAQYGVDLSAKPDS